MQNSDTSLVLVKTLISKPMLWTLPYSSGTETQKKNPFQENITTLNVTSFDYLSRMIIICLYLSDKLPELSGF